jgi:hypothetical protein
MGDSMSTIINATTTNGVVIQPDNSGSLVLQTNSGTTALTIDTSQRAAFVAGTAALPAITTTGDTNTGMFFPAADTIAFAEGGTEAMRLDTSGNVGIGTSTPQAKLDVNGGIINRAGAGTASMSWFGDIATANWTSSLGGFNLTFFNDNSSGSLGTGNVSANSTTFYPKAQFTTSGGLLIAGSTAQKSTGTTWSNPSDQRLKNNIRDYTKGTTELMQVRVREWEYNGKGGTTEGMKGLGVVADEVMTILPNTVETYNAKLNADDEEDTEIKKFDATEITWLLVKTVQEQQTIINDLKARVETLEAK